jgi:hypothetical protein
MNEILGLMLQAQVNFFLLVFCVEIDSLDVTQFDHQFQDQFVEKNRNDLKPDCLLRVFPGQQVCKIPALTVKGLHILVDLLNLKVKLKSFRFNYFRTFLLRPLKPSKRKVLDGVLNF